jgi:hypothetical protein
MISRFFKKKPKPEAPPEKPKAAAPKEVAVKPSASKKLLTAEGWKRMMMRKMAAKGKK